MAWKDGTAGTLESFDSFVDQLPEQFKASRDSLKKQWLLLVEEEAMDMTHPCTGGDSGSCWLNDHIRTLNAVLGKAALQISVNDSSTLSIAPAFACSFGDEEDELFARLVADWIVAHHSCLRELRFTSPGPVCLRMPGVRRLDVSRVPGTIVANAVQKGPLLESVKIHATENSMNIVDDLAAALRWNDRLKCFELSDNQFEPGSHKKLLEAVSGCERLETLAIEYDKLSPEDVQALRSLLQKSTHLKKLSLTGIDSESVMAAINDLEGSCSLEELHIFGIDNPQERFSLTFVGVLENLRVLSLVCCDVKSECAVGIAKHLVGNTSLKEVNLSSNDIGEAGALALAEALRENRSLEQLDISSNDLKFPTLVAFADALNVNTTLKTLRICEIDLSDEQSDRLFQEDRFKDLFKRLYIVWSQKRLEELCRILLADQHQPMLSLALDGDVEPEVIDDLFNALSVNKTVTKLHFYSEADLTPAFAKRLADFLKTNDSVRWVQNLMHARSEELVLDILEGLKHNRTVSYYQGYTDLITPAIVSAVRDLLTVNDVLNELMVCDHYAVEPDILGVLLEGLRENRTLVNLHIAWEPEVVEGLPEMWELLRRNKALVTLGARYVSGASTGADAAEALKMVNRSYALVKKVAEMTGKSKELARKDIAMALAGAERQLQHQRKGDGEDPGNQGRRHAKAATNPPAEDHTKVSSWARVASSPPPSLAIQALKTENIQLNRELEQLRQEIRAIKAECSLVTAAPPQDVDAGSEEPIIPTEDPEDGKQVENTPLANQDVRGSIREENTQCELALLQKLEDIKTDLESHIQTTIQTIVPAILQNMIKPLLEPIDARLNACEVKINRQLRESGERPVPYTVRQRTSKPEDK